MRTFNMAPELRRRLLQEDRRRKMNVAIGAAKKEVKSESSMDISHSQKGSAAPLPARSSSSSSSGAAGPANGVSGFPNVGFPGFANMNLPPPKAQAHTAAPVYSSGLPASIGLLPRSHSASSAYTAAHAKPFTDVPASPVLTTAPTPVTTTLETKNEAASPTDTLIEMMQKSAAMFSSKLDAVLERLDKANPPESKCAAAPSGAPVAAPATPAAVEPDASREQTKQHEAFVNETNHKFAAIDKTLQALQLTSNTGREEMSAVRLQLKELQRTVDSHHLMLSQLQDRKCEVLFYAIASRDLPLYDNVASAQSEKEPLKQETLPSGQEVALIHPPTVDAKGTSWIKVRRIFEDGSIVDRVVMFFDSASRTACFGGFSL